MIFELGLWLPAVADSGNCEVFQIMEICDIVLLDNGAIRDIFVVCKFYTTSGNYKNNLSYVVDMSSVQDQLTIVNIRQFLLKHHYPVKIHKIKEEFVFRCKRF